MTKQQCANGLWQAYRSNPAIACAPANPNNFTGPDTNSTSLAVQGLAAWGGHPKQSLVLQSLDAVQSANAGWPYIAAPNQAADPNSTALVIQALLEKSAPSGLQWARQPDPVTALLKYPNRLQEPHRVRALHKFRPSTAPNVFATVQAVPAMMSKTMPVASSTTSVTISL